MSDNDAPDHDRRYPTHDGSRGEAFRSYSRDFLAFARGKFAKDDRYSYHSAYHRKDEGGTHATAPAMPNQAGGAGGGVNPAFTAATTKRQIRMGQAFHFDPVLPTSVQLNFVNAQHRAHGERGPPTKAVM